jgi:hypothetical protein
MGRTGYNMGIFTQKIPKLKEEDEVSSSVKWCWFKHVGEEIHYDDIYFGLKDTDNAEYIVWWINYIKKIAPKDIDETIVMGLVNRWAFFYNNLDLSERFLRLNGLKNNITILNPDSNFNDIKEVDIIISLISWGFHYPISTYIDIVNNIISKDGLVILDIRHSILNESINEFTLRGFTYQTICKFQKCDRIVFKK